MWWYAVGHCPDIAQRESRKVTLVWFNTVLWGLGGSENCFVKSSIASAFLTVTVMQEKPQNGKVSVFQ